VLGVVRGQIGNSCLPSGDQTRVATCAKCYQVAPAKFRIVNVVRRMFGIGDKPKSERDRSLTFRVGGHFNPTSIDFTGLERADDRNYFAALPGSLPHLYCLLPTTSSVVSKQLSSAARR
jgi:hypothetical protein